MDFRKYLDGFLGAVRKKDKDYIRKAYSEYDIKSQMSEEDFFGMIFQMLGGIAEKEPDELEEFGDFAIAMFKDSEGQMNLTFVKKGDSFVVYNDRKNYAKFKKVYAIGYVVEGDARVGVRFNGKEFPVLRDIGTSGFASMINSALEAGENEITLLPREKPAKVTIRISSGKEGDIIDSAQGDVLSWEGVVKAPVKLRFKAE